MNKRSKKFIFLFSAIIIVVFFVFKFGSVYAFDFGEFGPLSAPTGSIPSLESGINTVFNTIITVAEVAFVLMFLIGGVMYLTAMGEEEGSKKAKKLILDAVIGIVIVLSAWAIGTWVLTTLRGNSTGSSSSSSSSSKVNDAVDKIIKNLGNNNSETENTSDVSNNTSLSAEGYSAGTKDGFISSLCSKTYNTNQNNSKYLSDSNYKQGYNVGFIDGNNKYQQWLKNTSSEEVTAEKMTVCPNAL